MKKYIWSYDDNGIACIQNTETGAWYSEDERWDAETNYYFIEAELED